MCTADGRSFGSVAEALRMADATMDYLNGPGAGELDAASYGAVLRSLGEIQAKLTAAHCSVLARFDAADAHDCDGYGTSAAWLAAMARMSARDAKAAVRQMRALGRHRPLAQALAAGEISASWAQQILDWIKTLPGQLRDDTGAVAGIVAILVRAAASGASLDDLKTILGRALALWQAAHPDPDRDDRFDDRYVQVGSTFGGAGVLRGNLTGECAAAVQAVLDALGKKAGPEDTRTEGQRFHDALQLGCELLIRAKMVPDRAGADTQVMVHIPLSQLRAMPGASELEDAWIRARPGEDGYLAGHDAQAAACDAQIIPVVTGHPDMTVIDKIINLALSAAGLTAGGGDGSGTGGADPDPASDHDTGGGTGGADPDPASDHDASGGTGDHHRARTGAGRAACRARARARAKAAQLTPEAAQALRYAIARLATDFVSGPSGIAGWLRTTLLTPPYSTPSLPLNIGWSDTIPAHIRRAVLLRDRTCAWPRCGRPAVYCDVHHCRHKHDGGETSVENCALVCQFHHDICIHRWGWELIVHPDGTTTAHGPDGQVLHSHSPPTTRAA
jgi:Domain of unknown function (DUF222)